jgi:hypothetical protein
MRKLVFVLGLVCLGAQAQVTCQQVGQFTYCSDGTTYQKVGNQIYIYPPPQSNSPSKVAPPPVIPTPQLQPTPPSLLHDLANPQTRRCGHTQTGQYVCI